VDAPIIGGSTFRLSAGEASLRGSVSKPLPFATHEADLRGPGQVFLVLDGTSPAREVSRKQALEQLPMVGHAKVQKLVNNFDLPLVAMGLERRLVVT
jgi:hypothetical protein